MSLLDRFVIYRPDPRKGQDWRARRGLPLDDVEFLDAAGI